MKGTCTLVASVLAASTLALSSSSAVDRDVAFYPSSNEEETTCYQKVKRMKTREDQQTHYFDRFEQKEAKLSNLETLSSFPPHLQVWTSNPLVLQEVSMDPHLPLCLQ
ncbi:uncharacterized protein LOC110618416 [Manihot esculenta]|uniref:uncharacterized protein LOC110618416 n=1 Tax=Manihot esculenta TaxID=3983 RepID=UPI001CC511A3|nr:uncharacterized protein LOC110618416 [Manihot esculenta]